MKKRNILAVLVLSVVTCGIYVLYWMYAVRKELVAKTGNPKDIPYVRLLFAPLLLVVPAIIAFSVANHNAAINILGVLLAIAAVVGTFVVSIFWTYRFCQVAGRVTQKTEGTMLFWIWIVCGLLGVGPLAMLIIQNDLNSLADGVTSPDGHQAPTAPTAPTAS